VTSDAVRDYATHLAVQRRVSASTQNQALSAILFLCREVLGLEVEALGLATRAKRSTHLPVVLSMPETAALRGAMRGTTWVMAALLYGGGLRVSDCCQLRIKDVDVDQGLIFVRGGKGAKDRSTLLAALGRDELRAHLQRAEARYRADRASGLAGVWLPDALERKYPNAGRELGWLWVFPSHALSTDPRAGIVRRHHLSDSVIQKAVKAAAMRANIHKPISVHTLRAQFCHSSFAQRRRHPADSGVPRPRACRDHHDLHARRQGAPQSGAESTRHPAHPRAALRRPPAFPLRRLVGESSLNPAAWSARVSRDPPLLAVRSKFLDTARRSRRPRLVTVRAPSRWCASP